MHENGFRVFLDCSAVESCLVDGKILDRRSQRSQSLVDAVLFLCVLCDLLFNGSFAAAGGLISEFAK